MRIFGSSGSLGILVLILYPFSECFSQVVSSLSELDPATPAGQVEANDAVPAADGGLGSTMTLEQLNLKPAAVVKAESQVLRVRPAGESIPALKYRLWQPDFTLEPGSAQLHFFRAMILWKEQMPEFRRQVEMWSVDDEPQPPQSELKDAIDHLGAVFEEIHLLAMSEDTTWDHRLRDLRGPALYAYLLPDVQESRSLARLLDQKVQLQIAQGDIEGAINSVRDGLRLAAFVGQGETLVQQLVGIAIESIVLNNVEQLLQMPDAPNFYWPLATLPRPFLDINRSIQFELGSIHCVLPILAEAEAEQHDDEYWNEKWAAMLRNIEMLGGNRDSKFALAMLSVVAAGPAKKRLVASGMGADEVDAMPALRAVLIDASQQIRNMSDDLAKANYLPNGLGNQIAADVSEDFEQWYQENRFKSAAAVIMSLLSPAVQAAKSAGVRQEYVINRLMTIEALRMHAANHAGQLPGTLDELDPVPALPNPFNGQPFRYQVARDGNAQLVTLSADVPRNAEHMKQVRIRFED